ncbi:MAG: tRNA lysidine(34) synthetase TilS [Candidatus Eisenbacteria bacterium]
MNWTKADVSIRARFRHGIRLAKIEDGAPLVVSVSGGADSVALLDLTAREARGRGWRLHVVHVDHGWRPESGDDARFVRSLAKRFGVRGTGYRIRPEAWERSRLGSREATARRIRRRACQRLAARIGAGTVLLGHNRDDQVETILLQLLRGTGIRGLIGMPPTWALGPTASRGGPGRTPGLPRAARTPWREDSSNQDLSFLRNRIRHQLLPLIEAEIRPGTGKSLLRMADALRSQVVRFEGELREAWRTIDPDKEPGSIRLDRPKLANYDPDLVEGILQWAFRAVSKGPAQLGQAHLRALEKALGDSVPRQFDLPSGVRAFVNAREVRLVVTTGQNRTGPRPRLT